MIDRLDGAMQASLGLVLLSGPSGKENLSYVIVKKSTVSDP